MMESEPTINGEPLLHTISDSKIPQRKSELNLTMSYDHHLNPKFPLCELTLPELFERQVKLGNTETGISWYRPEAKLSYAELYHQGKKIAKGLIALGLKRGDKVVSISSDGPDCLLLFIAAGFIGCMFSARQIFSPTPANIKSYLKTMRPKLVLLGCTPTGFELVNPFNNALECLEELTSTDSEFSTLAVYRDRYSSQVDDKVNRRELFETLMTVGDSVSDEILDNYKSLVTPNEPCFYTFSSGSTGESKRILVSAAALANMGTIKEESWEDLAHCPYAAPSICAEDIGFVDSVVTGMWQGNEILSIPAPSTWDYEIACSEILMALAKHKVGMAYVDQHFLVYIIHNPDIMRGLDLTHLTGMILSGSGSSVEFRREVLIHFSNSLDTYGLSEYYYATLSHPTQWKKKIEGCGRCSVNTEIKIVDDNGNCLPINEQGEIWLRGALAFLEYETQPKLTASVFTSDGWFKTGDCGKMDRNGALQIIGRLSSTERFSVLGDVVYAQSIEQTMKSCDLIKEIAVVGRSTGNTCGDELCYCIVLFEKDSMTMEAVDQYAQEKMPDPHQWPFRVFFYDKFPLQGGRHKVARKVLTKEVSEKVEEDKLVNICDASYNVY